MNIQTKIKILNAVERPVIFETFRECVFTIELFVKLVQKFNCKCINQTIECKSFLKQKFIYLKNVTFDNLKSTKIVSKKLKRCQSLKSK